MKRCLQLAELGRGYVAPNPMVGALLVYNDCIFAEGFHRQFGGPHAEVNCLQNVREEDLGLIEKSTLYVSLEPCVHFGKTAPCADLIISKGIPEVVIGCRDSNALVNGKGIEKLEKAGVKVGIGILEKECLAINRRFFTFQQKKRPYIILKWAQSLDKKIALKPINGSVAKSNERLFITNSITNRLVHKWRGEEAAILVGTQTALLDDPSLTSRLWNGPDPVRVVIDNQLRLSGSLKLFDGKVRTLVFNQIRQEDKGMISFIKTGSSSGLPGEVLMTLYEMGLSSVIVEGGAILLNSFIVSGVWDEARVITNEGLLAGEGYEAPVLYGKEPEKEEQLFTDRISYYFNESA